MGINIGNYGFDGPFLSTSGLMSRSGVYSILGRHNELEQWMVVDIGEAGDVRIRVECHDRKDCWKRQGYPSLSVAALYCDERARTRIEQELRAQFNPACGDR
jgi:hypothetical protein